MPTGRAFSGLNHDIDGVSHCLLGKVNINPLLRNVIKWSDTL